MTNFPNTDRAQKSMNMEIDDIAADMVERGMSAYEALNKARDIVRARRAKKAAQAATNAPS